MLQLRPEYGVMVDSDAFLGAFTMENGGQRVKIGPWSLGPGYRPQQTSDHPAQSILPTDYKLIDQENIRVPMRLKWEKYYWHAAGHIPYAVCKANGAPPLDTDSVNEGPTCASQTDNGDGDDEPDIEMGGIGFDHESGYTLKERLGGRPLNCEHI